MTSLGFFPPITEGQVSCSCWGDGTWKNLKTKEQKKREKKWKKERKKEEKKKEKLYSITTFHVHKNHSSIDNLLSFHRCQAIEPSDHNSGGAL